jgi:exodeoxyribonuclease VII large subunit
LLHLTHRLAHSGQRLREISNARLSHLKSGLVYAQPSMESRLERMQHLGRRLVQITQHQVALRLKQVTSFQSQLSLLCPTLVLRRGYSIVRTTSGVVVMSAAHVHEGQRLSVELAHGQLGVEVRDKV